MYGYRNIVTWQCEGEQPVLYKGDHQCDCSKVSHAHGSFIPLS